MRILRAVLRLPVRYCVTLGVLVVPVLATLLAQWALGDDRTVDDVRELGYGVPALEEGRWWTLFTGTVLIESLAIPLPSFTAIGVVVYEHVAGHWRALVALIGGQVLGVLLVLLVALPFRDEDGVIAQELTTSIDFGISVGGFACLGAWTAYLRAPLRRALRVGGSCYQLGPLLFSGLIFDFTHPAGWALGLLAGPVLMRPRHEDRRRWRRSDVMWVALAVVVGGAIGFLAGWNGGGIGGLFGWGPE